MSDKAMFVKIAHALLHPTVSWEIQEPIMLNKHWHLVDIRIHAPRFLTETIPCLNLGRGSWIKSTPKQEYLDVNDQLLLSIGDSKSVVGYYDGSTIPVPGIDAGTYDWKLLDYLKQTDWIIDLNPRPLMGLFSAFAGALGIQWSCFDLPPNTDGYSAARRHLVPFPKEGLKSANAEEIAGHLVRQLHVVFNDDTERNKGAGSYNKRLDGFTDAVGRLFKKKKKRKRS